MKKIILENKEYEFSELNEKSQALALKLSALDERIIEAKNMQALLTKAKRAYIFELKSEMLSAKSGLDFNAE